MPFPNTLQELSPVGGMSTNGIAGGVHHLKDKEGCHYTLKTIGKSTDRNYWECLLSEYYAVKAYDAMGVPVPQVKLYDVITKQQVTEANELSVRKNIGVLFKNIYGTQKLKDYLDADVDGSRYHHVQKKVQKYFVADCLFGNNHSIGDQFENMLINPYTRDIVRMNCSGTFGYSNKGDIVRFGTSEIEGLKILRDTTQKPEAIFFKTISHNEFKKQAIEITSKSYKFIPFLPKNLHMIKNFVELRLDLLKRISALPDVEGLDKIDYQAWKSKTQLIEKRRFLCDIFKQEQISDEDVSKFLASTIVNTILKEEIFYIENQKRKEINWLGDLLKETRPNVFKDLEL